MDRRDHLLKYVSKQSLGIEVGPWISPIAPKREGYNCLVLDVFDTYNLKKKAADDPNIADRLEDIEEVDLIGSAVDIDQIVAARYTLPSFDYVISSHNFEHLANPIKFLQGCAKVLKPGGVVSMAIPDHRTCFDFFRPLTMLTDWLAAYVEDRKRPTPLQNFHHAAFFANFDDGNYRGTSFFRFYPVEHVGGPANLQDVFQELMGRLGRPTDEYVDAHCSAFTPASFELLLLDCEYLGLLSFTVIEVADLGCEFHAHLRRSGDNAPMSAADHQAARDRLMHRMKDEEAEASVRYRAVAAEREALRVTADELRAVISQYRQSASWKATVPLRWIGSNVRQLIASIAR